MMKITNPYLIQKIKLHFCFKIPKSILQNLIFFILIHTNSKNISNPQLQIPNWSLYKYYILLQFLPLKSNLQKDCHTGFNMGIWTTKSSKSYCWSLNVYPKCLFPIARCPFSMPDCPFLSGSGIFSLKHFLS